MNHLRNPCFNPVPQPSPHLAFLIASSEALSDVQEAELRRLRLDGGNRLKGLDALIEETQQMLAHLQAQHGALSSRIAEYDIALHPIRRVPPDILCEIFSLATSIGVSPYRITAICRSWRRIATSFHLLWRKLTALYLPVPRVQLSHEGLRFWDFGCTQRLVPSLETYIRNSDTCTLFLDVYIDCLFPCSHPVYRSIIQSVKRVEQLRLHVRDPRILETSSVRNLIQCPANLTSVALGFDPAYSMMPPDAISLPKTLRRLIIVPWAWLANRSINLALDHIEHLVLRSRHLGQAETSSRSVKDILSRTRFLLSLTLSNSWDGTRQAEYNQRFPARSRGIQSHIEMPFELAHLQELVVEHENTSVLHVLDDITLPSLERLQVVTPSKDIVPIFKKMFQRSGCMLTHLTIRDPTSIDSVVSLLRLCGSLRQISLLRIALPFLDFLIFLLDKNGASCPSLRVLVMDVSCASQVDRDVQLVFVDRFLDILELRCSNNANNAEPDTSALESATLYVPRESMLPFTPYQEERIKELRRTGLELYVYRYAPDEPRVY